MLRLSFAVEFGAAPPILRRAVTATLPEIDSIVYLLSMALNNAIPGVDGTGDHGWAAILPRYVVEADLASGVLAAIGVPGLDLRERMVLGWRPDKVFSKLQRRLMEQMRRELKERTGEAGDVESHGK